MSTNRKSMYFYCLSENTTRPTKLGGALFTCLPRAAAVIMKKGINEDEYFQWYH